MVPQPSRSGYNDVSCVFGWLAGCQKILKGIDLSTYYLANNQNLNPCNASGFSMWSSDAYAGKATSARFPGHLIGPVRDVYKHNFSLVLDVSFNLGHASNIVKYKWGYVRTLLIKVHDLPPSQSPGSCGLSTCFAPEPVSSTGLWSNDGFSSPDEECPEASKSDSENVDGEPLGDSEPVMDNEGWEPNGSNLEDYPIASWYAGSWFDGEFWLPSEEAIGAGWEEHSEPHMDSMPIGPLSILACSSNHCGTTKAFLTTCLVICIDFF